MMGVKLLTLEWKVTEKQGDEGWNGPKGTEIESETSVWTHINIVWY